MFRWACKEIIGELIYIEDFIAKIIVLFSTKAVIGRKTHLRLGRE